jgi:hypothetical protein
MFLSARARCWTVIAVSLILSFGPTDRVCGEELTPVVPGDPRLRDNLNILEAGTPKRNSEAPVSLSEMPQFSTTTASIPTGSGEWQAQFYPIGLGGRVNAALSFEGDIIAGGYIWSAGPEQVRHLVRWDGTVWQSFGAPDDEVQSLIAYHGLLIVGGRFRHIGGIEARGLAAWDGSTWRALDHPFHASTTAMLVHRGRLVVGLSDSYFYNETEALYAWDGSLWTPLGLTGMYDAPDVAALAVYKGDLIVAAGRHEEFSIGRWNGSGWENLSVGSRPRIHALAVRKGELFAGGTFSSIGGVDASSIAAWNGKVWSPLGDGMSCLRYPCLTPNGTVQSLLATSEGLIVGGNFLMAGGIPVAHIARWNGTWSSLAEGIDATNRFPTTPTVSALFLYDRQLIAAGDFREAGTTTAQSIAAFDGTTWHPVAVPGGNPIESQIYTSVVWNGRLVIGGGFERAGADPIRHVAIWEDDHWSPLGDGPGGEIAALTVHNGDLIAAGYVNPENVSSKYVVRWDGTHWSRIGGPFNYAIWSLASINGELFAGGYFTHVEGKASPGIARWDGLQWNSLGAGLSESGSNYTYVGSIAAHGGLVVAGGSFVRSGQQPLLHVAAWNGSTWSPFGAGFNGTVISLLNYDGSLHAGGTFMLSGNTSVKGIARWDGLAWLPVGGGVTTAGFYEPYSGVFEMTALDNRLYVTGRFDHAGPVAAASIAEWDGSTWQNLGSGITSAFNYETSASTITSWNGDIYVGGPFRFAGGVPSENFARWSPTVVASNTSTERRIPSHLSVAHHSRETGLAFRTTVSGPVVLRVFDISGREVARPVDTALSPGNHEIAWDGRDSGGRKVSAGIYFYSLVTPDGALKKKVLVR